MLTHVCLSIAYTIKVINRLSLERLVQFRSMDLANIREEGRLSVMMASCFDISKGVFNMGVSQMGDV